MTDRREQTATYIACFDADTGSSRWVRYLGSASPDVDNFFGMPMQFGMTAPGDFNHRLLSLDGPALYYQTNLGAVVALEAETGATLWVATYPRQEPNHAWRQWQRARSEPRGGPRRPGVRGPQRRRRHLRVRRRQRPPALEERSDLRRRQALSPSGSGQGSAGRHRQPRPALRRQDRQAAPCLARFRQVARRLWPRAPGRRFHLLADHERDPGPRPADGACVPSRRSSCSRLITPRGETWSRATAT